jgi:hypothetical protein
MAGSLLPLAKQIVPDNSWNPGVGFQFYTYLAGADPTEGNKKATYQDSALLSANTNPVIANARGEVTMYGTGLYRIILKDADGATIWDRDNVGGVDTAVDVLASLLSATTGAALIGGGAQFVSSMTGLRALLKTSASVWAIATGYAAKGDGGGGIYYYDSSDTTSADNAGTIIVATDGGRWKLAQNRPISPKQFGAKGDASTIDDTAFANFEAVIAGADVDLIGATYLVTSIPAKNRYTNGRFAIAKTTTIGGASYPYTWNASAAELTEQQAGFNLLRDSRTSRSTVVAMLTRVLGLQGVSIDQVNNSGAGFAYTLHVNGSPEVSYISQYTLTGQVTTFTPTGVSNSNSAVGHQGLTIEQRNNGTVKLWASVRYDATNFPSGHRQVVRFNYAGDAADLTNLEYYTLFDSTFSYTTNATVPSISPCGTYIVALGRKGSRDFYIRVFLLKTLVDGGAGDYSAKYEYEFHVDTDILLDDSSGAFRPVQSIACDASSVYILSGNATLNEKRIDRYSLKGRLIQSNTNISVGLTEATSDGTFYEPEALFFYAPDGGPQYLCMCVTSAAGGAHKNRLWAMGWAKPAGRWTPTLTNVTNVAASTAFSGIYSRLGNVVTYTTRVNADPTAAGYCELRFTPPIPSDFTSLTDGGGTLCMTGVSGAATTVDTGTVEADTTNDALVIKWICTDTANRAFWVTGSYEVK